VHRRKVSRPLVHADRGTASAWLVALSTDTVAPADAPEVFRERAGVLRIARVLNDDVRPQTTDDLFFVEVAPPHDLAHGFSRNDEERRAVGKPDVWRVGKRCGREPAGGLARRGHELRLLPNEAGSPSAGIVSEFHYFHVLPVELHREGRTIGGTRNEDVGSVDVIEEHTVIVHLAVHSRERASALVALGDEAPGDAPVPHDNHVTTVEFWSVGADLKRAFGESSSGLEGVAKEPRNVHGVNPPEPP